MSSSILESPILKYPKPWWLPFISLFMTLYGILMLQWDLKPIIFLFWWEVILMVGTALIRMLCALDKRPFLETLTSKITLLFGGIVMGGAMIMFAVTFSINAFEKGDTNGLASISIQTRMMTIAYLTGLLIHYFANGRYLIANPGTELFRTLMHLLVLLAFLMAITMHILPAFPQWNQARWVAIAVVVLKFGVDWLFSKINLSDLAAQPTLSQQD
jgi:Family of unknown function (DUF6498)